jgi:membrane-associated phospholipid phosphatase
MILAGSLPNPARTWVRLAAAAGIVLVGMARVILRAHWPSDVLGGIALGLALAAAAALMASRPGRLENLPGRPKTPRRRGVPD